MLIAEGLQKMYSPDSRAEVTFGAVVIRGS